MSDATETTQAPKKKKGGKMILIAVAVLVLGGIGGGGFYAYSAGLIGGGQKQVVASGPKLVPKSEQKRVSGSGEGADAAAAAGNAPPAGTGGDKYASNYYALDKEFTSNLQDSVHFIQVGIAMSTPYDDTVIQNVKTNEIAVRSAILMALGDTTEDQVFTTDGKKKLTLRLVKAINDTLKEKEGFGGIGNVYFTNFVVQ